MQLLRRFEGQVEKKRRAKRYTSVLHMVKFVLMKRLTKYIGMQLATALVIIAFSLTAIVWLTQALRFIDYIVNRGVSSLTFLQLTGLMVPSLLFIILPFAVFVSVLFIYHRLTQDSELVVLRAAGQSRWQMARPVVMVAGGATILAYFISLYLMPITYHKFKDMQSFLRDNYASLLLQEEVFNTPIKGLTVFVRKRQANGELQGLLVHDNREAAQPITMMAQRGRIEQTPSGPRFLLFNGNRQELRNGRFSFLKFDEYAVDLSFYAADASNRTRKPEEYYVHELFAEAKEKPMRAGELLAEAHHRITWPIYTLVLGLFAFATLMRGEFNRRGQAKRITVISAAAIIVVAMALGMQYLISKNPSLIPLIYVNLGGWLAFIIWQLRDQSFRAIPLMGREVPS